MSVNVYTCGVPAHQCTGSESKVSKDVHKYIHKVHGTSEAAFRCHVKWMQSQGYVMTSSRTLKHADGGPTIMLTKKSRFGGIMRKGKRPEGQRRATRWMPAKRGGGLVASY